MDTPAQFKAKNKAQFNSMRGAIQRIKEEFVIVCGADVIENTRGFGNQIPEDTRYVPTGRLRAGWTFTRAPIGSTSKGLGAARNEDGPFSDYGAETLAAIEADVRGADLRGKVYLENDVGYAFLIVIGGGRHAIPDPWPERTYQKMGSLAKMAQSNARYGGAR